MAFVDIPAMALWGVAMPLMGAPIDSRLGWIMAGQLGLFSAVFETLQVLRDRRIDQSAGVRTTAVKMGSRQTILLARGLWTRAKALYGSVWLTCCAWLYVGGHSEGLIGGASRADSLPALTALMELW